MFGFFPFFFISLWGLLPITGQVMRQLWKDWGLAAGVSTCPLLFFSVSSFLFLFLFASHLSPSNISRVSPPIFFDSFSFSLRVSMGFQLWTGTREAWPLNHWCEFLPSLVNVLCLCFSSWPRTARALTTSFFHFFLLLFTLLFVLSRSRSYRTTRSIPVLCASTKCIFIAPRTRRTTKTMNEFLMEF